MNLIWKSILFATILANLSIILFSNFSIIDAFIFRIDDINFYNEIFFFVSLMVCMVLNIISIFKLLANQYISKFLMFYLNINNLLNIFLIFIGLLVIMLSSGGGGGFFCIFCGVKTEVLIFGTISYIFSFINILVIHNLIINSVKKLNLFKNKEKVKVKTNNISLNDTFTGFITIFTILFLVIFFISDGFEPLEIFSFILITIFTLIYSIYNLLKIIKNFYLIFTVKTQN